MDKNILEIETHVFNVICSEGYLKGGLKTEFTIEDTLTETEKTEILSRLPSRSILFWNRICEKEFVGQTFHYSLNEISPIDHDTVHDLIRETLDIAETDKIYNALRLTIKLLLIEKAKILYPKLCTLPDGALELVYDDVFMTDLYNDNFWDVLRSRMELALQLKDALDNNRQAIREITECGDTQDLLTDADEKFFILVANQESTLNLGLIQVRYAGFTYIGKYTFENVIITKMDSCGDAAGQKIFKFLVADISRPNEKFYVPQFCTALDVERYYRLYSGNQKLMICDNPDGLGKRRKLLTDDMLRNGNY